MSTGEAQSPTQDQLNTRWPTMTDGRRKTKKRVRNFTPADRAAHRVFEKTRREAFNDQLMELARSIPTISSSRRLSKHTIVNESISYHHAQSRRCLAAVHGIRSILAEREELLGEVNRLRALLKPGQMSVRAAQPLNDQVLELIQHEQEFIDSLNKEKSQQQSSESPDQIRTDSDNSANIMVPHVEYSRDAAIQFEDVNSGPVALSNIQADYELWKDLDTVLPMSIDLRGGEYPVNDMVATDLQMPTLDIPEPSTIQHMHCAIPDEMFLLNGSGNPNLHSHTTNGPESIDNLAFYIS